MSFREVVHSENILLCRSLLKKRINFWEEDLSTDSLQPEKFMEVLHDQDCNIETLELSTESKEVGFVIAKYVANKLKSDCLVPYAIVIVLVTLLAAWSHA